MTFIYVEGDAKLAPGFRKLFEQFKGVKVIPCGNDQSTKDRWEREKTNKPDDTHLLLVDSDGPAPQPPQENQFFMVQVMESWFLADKDRLSEYFGRGFNRNALPKAPVETVSGRDVLSSLKLAIKGTNKSDYHKVKHGGDLLMRIRVDVARQNAPNFDRLLKKLANNVL